MRLGIIPESMLERIGLALGRAPEPLLETQLAYTLARALMVAVRVGLFEAVGEGASSEAVAQRCQTDGAATRKLLGVLTSCGYVRRREGRYTLTKKARRWVLSGSPRSLRDKLLLQFLEWRFVEHFEEFVRTGRHLDFHRDMSSDEWRLYQRGMRSLAALLAPEVAERTPVPAAARDLLDIGGSHGHYSVVLCRRHPELRAVILDLPEAVEQAAPLLAEERMGERVRHRSGDALRDDLGTEAWDVVFVSQLVHHFDEAANRDLTVRVARALRPGGAFVVQDLMRPGRGAGQGEALLDLYFAATSRSGTWTPDEIADWQREAGLVPRKTVHLRSLPGSAQQVAVKPH